MAVAHACGDKFLMVGRSGRFNQAYAAIYPATILLYAPGGRAASAAILDPKFQVSLNRAGHRIEVVKNEEQAGQMFQAGRFDIVLADAADADALKARAAQSPSQPTVMPVLFNPTKAEAEAIKARYQCELKPIQTVRHAICPRLTRRNASAGETTGHSQDALNRCS